jgi:hypothetical protein
MVYSITFLQPSFSFASMASLLRANSYLPLVFPTGLLPLKPVPITLLWVRVSSTPSTWPANVVSSDVKMFKGQSRHCFTISSLYLHLHSPLVSVGPNNIFLRIFISKESIFFANIPRFTNFPLVPLLCDYSDNEICVFSLFLHKENPLVSEKHTITKIFVYLDYISII